MRTVWQRVCRRSPILLKRRVQTGHDRIITCGLLVGLVYLPTWLKELAIAALRGSTAVLLIAIVYLGVQALWKQRSFLAQLYASEEDRVLGYVLILSSAAIFPFCFFAVWSQAIVWTLTVTGIVLCTWGIKFFRHNLLVVVLFLLSVYPQPGVTGRLLWTTLTPPYLLENVMAWAGGGALRAIGYAVTVNDRFLLLANKGVEVEWGCNGFSMALNLAAASFLLGLFLKLSWQKIVGIMAFGIVLALVFNVPRIMLLTLAAVYWGEGAFKFWHGPIGGQLIAGILFTVYYYVIMGFANRREKG